MGRQYKVTDGTTTVDMISTSDPGIMAVRGGLGPVRGRNDIAIINQQIAGLKVHPTIETYRLNIHGTSHNNAASQVQDLFKLLRKAREYNDPRTPNQEDPVYIISQTTEESGTRYALVYGMPDWLAQDLYRVPFEAENHLEEFEITIIRERYWRDTIPETLPTSLTIGNKPMNDAVYADLDAGAAETGNYDLIFRKTAAALKGDYGAEVTINGSDSAVLRFEFPDDLTTCSVQFEFDPNTVDMNDTASFRICFGSESDNTAVWRLYLVYTTADGYRLKLETYNDADAVDSTNTVDITDEAHTIKLEWVRSTGAGNDDGTTDLYIDGVAEVQQTGIDNDTVALDEYWIGVHGYSGTVTGGTIFFDDIKFADSIDEDWHFTIDFEDAKYVPVANHYQKTQITHVFNYDDSLTAFSQNLVSQHDATLFEVSGSTPALSDIVYIGSEEGPIFAAYAELATAQVSDATVKLQYYNGSWTDLDAGFDWKLENGLAFMTTNNNASDWATVAINGVTAHWLRLIITSFTSWTTSPVLNRAIYAVHGNYLEIHSDRIAGDVDPLAMLRYSMQDSKQDTVGWMACGLKSRGLDSFESIVNAGGDNPDGWTITAGTDTSGQAEDQAPSNAVMQCTFATATLETRVTFAYDGGTNPDYRGAYRVFLRAKQVGGSAGDVTIRMDYKLQSTIQGEEIDMALVGEEVELIDCGRYEILPMDIVGSEDDEVIEFDFILKAKSGNGSTPNLEVYDIVLLPVDEWSVIARHAGLDGQLLTVNRGIQIDSGVLRKGAIYVRANTPWTADNWARPLVTWQLEGDLPRLPVGKRARLYFLFASYDSVGDFYESGAGLGGIMELYTVEQWELLRGAA